MEYHHSDASPGSRPPELDALLESREVGTRDRAWWAFLRRYGALLFCAAASFAGHSDPASRYSCAVAELRRNDFGYLRTFGGWGRFTTWLVALGRRVALLHENGRCQCGVLTAADATAAEKHDEDARMIEALAAQLDLRHIADPTGTNPERQLRFRLICEHLAELLHGLAARDRLLLALRFVDGRSNRDVARTMGLPTAYRARRQVGQVLRAIREAL